MRSALSTDLHQRGGRPFGGDENGRPIRNETGRLNSGAIKALRHHVGAEVGASLPGELGADERDARIDAACDDASYQIEWWQRSSKRIRIAAH